MTYRLRIAGALAGAAFALALPAAAPAADADILREMQDRQLIQQMKWNYSRAIDTFNADAYVAVFTPDGAFGQTKGSAALRKMVEDLKKSRAEREAKGERQQAMHHVESNEYIEFVDRDHARVHYYWMTVFGPPPGPPGAGAGATAQPPRVAAVGNGVDDVVRVNGKWLIQNRNVAPNE